MSEIAKFIRKIPGKQKKAFFYMEQSKSAQEKFNQLRRQAEELMKGKAFVQAPVEFENPLKLINELQTFQIEHELQAEELNRSQQELIELKIRYEELYDYAPVGYIRLDLKGKILNANLTFADMLSIEKSYLIDRPLSDHIVFEDQDIFFLHLQKLFISQTKQMCDLRMQTKQGTSFYVQLESTVMLNKNRSPGQYHTVIIDITQRKRSEEELRNSEIKYRTMMESITDQVYICSPEFTVEFMNPAMIKRLGRDAKGEDCHKVMHGLDHRCDWCVFDKVAHGNAIETTIISPLDGRNYRVTNMPVRNKNGSVSKMTIFRDITDYLTAVKEKEDVQAQLQQAQRIEAIGALAGGIAHDFNNILFPIVGFAEMLVEDLPENSDLREGLSEILSGAMRAKELVKQILTFSRQADHEIKPLKPHLIINEVVKLIKSVIPTSIQIKKFIDPDTRTVLADPTKIHQIAMNLITNAYHAMQESGGVLTVKLQNMDRDDIMEKNLNLGDVPHVLLSIADTGPGMDKITLEKIFDPYFTTKPKGKGTGLGLSVVYGIVTAYGGVTCVNSIPGKGTVFDVYLPAVGQDVVSGLHQALSPIPKGNERILLVDDEEAVLRMEKLILERLGYRVEIKNSSLDALKAVKASPDSFDLVVSDMTMPEMTGDELAKKIMEIKPLLPVIICTGFSEKISLETAKSIGVKALLMKPIITSEFAATVRKTIDEALLAPPK